MVFDKKEIEKETIGNWDRSLLNRAFMNILSNAVEHTPSGSQLLLTARVEDDEFKFICLDSGPGFSLESLENATQLFYQEDKSRQSRNHSGLGLTIANDIIRLHYGSLSLANDNGTGGAKVTIILPLLNTDTPSRQMRSFLLILLRVKMKKDLWEQDFILFPKRY